MIERHDVAVKGCSPMPLAHYLKALGVLRIIVEDRDDGDTDARGYWKDDVFHIVSRFEKESLKKYFLEFYKPTPIVSPWNGRGGFLEGEDDEESSRTGAKMIRAIKDSGSPRLFKYREAINWYLTKRVLRQYMLRTGSGRIINISSVVGHTGNAGQIPYTMEKAALDVFTKSLCRELAGRNILVNSVAPGFIDTEMTSVLPGEIRERLLADVPLGRMGRPEEVAEVVAFLATKGSYITGTVIHVNGGLYGG